MVSVCPKTDHFQNLDVKHMNSVVMVHQDWECLAWYKQQNSILSVRIANILNCRFQKQQTK